jgi:hypothetical protein
VKPMKPPYLLDCILRLLLSPRDRETVSGDVYEAFLEVKTVGPGAWRAHLWYVRQLISFVPGRARSLLLQGPALRLLCACTALAGCWLGMMDLLWRHTGYVGQTGIAALIVSQASLTVASLRFRRGTGLRALAIVGSLALLWLAASVLKATFDGAQPEGYALLIAVSLIVQAVLTLLTLRTAGLKPGANV